MKTLLKTVIIILSLPFSSVCMAEGTTTPSGREHAHPAVTFQIIQNQLDLNNDAIESASINYPNTTTDAYTYGVWLKLSPSATEQLHKLTQENIDQQINIILNGNLISSPTIQSAIGNQMLITGLTEQQAIQFIQRLNIK